jgi:Rho termination factor, N-terminal domain
MYTIYQIYIQTLTKMTVTELKLECKQRGLSGYSRLNKAALIELLESDTNQAYFEPLQPILTPLPDVEYQPIERSLPYSIPVQIKQGFWKRGVFYSNRVVSTTQGKGLGKRKPVKVG